MTRTAVLVFAAASSLVLLVYGCDFGAPVSQSHDESGVPPPEVNRNGFKITFALTNAAGQFSTSVRTGEPFDITFSMRNETGQDQVYYQQGPLLVLEIWQQDSVVVSDIDGLAWCGLIDCKSLNINGTLAYKWRAPQPLGSVSKVVLSPGAYRVIASFRTTFNGIQVEPPEPIQFNVVE